MVLYSGPAAEDPFMSSAEEDRRRHLQKRLDFTRNRLVDVLKEDKIHPMDLLGRFTAPIRWRGATWTLSATPAPTSSKMTLTAKHPELLEAFSDIIEGDYKVSKDGEVWYVPRGNRFRLSLVAGSSSNPLPPRTSAFARHVASPGDILMVERAGAEPAP